MGGGLVIAVSVVGAVFYAFNAIKSGYAALSFVSATADYYVGIRIGDEDLQVAQGRELMERFPGGAKWADVFDNAIEFLLRRTARIVVIY